MVRAIDVARLAGTSTAVVSYVVNNGPRPVSPETRQKVLDAAEQLNYTPNRLARSLRTSRTDMVGVLVPDITAPYFAALGKDLERRIADNGQLTLMVSTETTQLGEAEALAAFRSAQVDGIVLVWSEQSISLPDFGSTPTVLLFNCPPDYRGPTIRADNEQAVHRAVHHLQEHGHEDVMFLAGLVDRGPVGERVQAWRQAIADPNAEPLRSAYDNASAAALLAELVTERVVPRDIITASDEQAIGLLAAAYEHQLHVPNDLAIISLDGSPATAYTAPPLTVMHQSTTKMANAALSALAGEEFAPMIDAELIVRQSCGCVSVKKPKIGS